MPITKDYSQITDAEAIAEIERLIDEEPGTLQIITADHMCHQDLKLPSTFAGLRADYESDEDFKRAKDAYDARRVWAWPSGSAHPATQEEKKVCQDWTFAQNKKPEFTTRRDEFDTDEQYNAAKTAFEEQWRHNVIEGTNTFSLKDPRHHVCLPVIDHRFNEASGIVTCAAENGSFTQGKPADVLRRLVEAHKANA